MTAARPAAGREPLHSRVAGWLERAFNPIVVKELRGSLRGLRFFIAHLTILSVFACVLLFVFLGKIAEGVGWNGVFVSDPSRIGREVFVMTQALHLAVVFLVLPSLAATSITGERERLTHEMLLSTTMTAGQIVWGKFVAAMTQAFVIFVSLVPLVGLCFLFGGITVYQIVANYAFLFALAALVVAFALNISASSRTTQRAVATVYVFSFLGCLFLWGLGAGLERSGFVSEAAVAYGFISRGTGVGEFAGGGLFERVMYVHVLPGFAWAALLALFFLAATNRLKPIFANRSTALRVYFVLAIAGAGVLTVLTLYHELPPTRPDGPGASARVVQRTDARAVAVTSLAIAALTVSLLSALFACEDPILPAHLRAQVEAMRGWRRAFRCLWPGATSGAVFTVAFMGAFLVGTFAALAPFSRGFDEGPWRDLPQVLPTAIALGSVFLWACFAAAYARFLGVTLASRPVLLRTIFVLTCVFVTLFPIVHWAISTTIEGGDRRRATGPVTLGLSPAAAILSAMDFSTGLRNFPRSAGGIPVYVLYGILASGGTALLVVLGNRAEARLKARDERLRGDPPPERGAGGNG